MNDWNERKMNDADKRQREQGDLNDAYERKREQGGLNDAYEGKSEHLVSCRPVVSTTPTKGGENRIAVVVNCRGVIVLFSFFCS